MQKKVTRKNNKNYIVPHPLKQGEEAEYYVVNIDINPSAFLGWLLTDVHGDGHCNYSDMVTVVGPQRINNSLYDFYIGHAKKMMDRVSKEDIERYNKSTDRFLKK